MLPAFLLTVRTPSATTHCAGEPSCADTHSFWLLPSNRTIASEGADPLEPGVTIFGSWLQTSVSSGVGFCWATANATEATNRIRMLSTRFRMAHSITQIRARMPQRRGSTDYADSTDQDSHLWNL